MAKKKNKTMSLAINGAAIISAVMVIISMFMKFNKTVTPITGTELGSFTGFELYKQDYAASKVFLTVAMILAIAIAALGVLRILGMFNGNLFTLIFAGAGVALVIFSVLMFTTVTKGTFDGNNYESDAVKRGIGAILHLIFSIIAGLSCAGAFVLKSK